MLIKTTRRRIITGASLAAYGLLMPAHAFAVAELWQDAGFTHDVASGEPSSDSMLLWTRYVPPVTDYPISLQAELSLDPAFTRIVAGGSVQTGGWRDWTAKLQIDGLTPATVYFYRFIAPDGTRSPAGRTRTLPAGRTERFGLAVFSCSNAPVGRFNAYADAARRSDIDLWFHVGDYIYENDASKNAPLLRPAKETTSLADYRLRYASYRADPDLKALHRQAPMIALWDDHESSNNSWEGGAHQHQPDVDGDWNIRKSAAMQAYREWLPVSDEPWKAYSIGDLATIYRTESRLLARTWHPETEDLMAQGDPTKSLIAYRDGAWSAPSATMLGSTQESWLSHRLRQDARSSTWQLVGMGTNVGIKQFPKAAMDWLRPDASAKMMTNARFMTLATQLGFPSNIDNWGGYPAARSRLLRSAQEADANLVMLTGDSHNAWAFEMAEGGIPVGVEFGGHSVTSNGLEKNFRHDPASIARQMIEASPELRWADTSQRGYMMMEIRPERVTGEWRFMNTIKRRDASVASVHQMSVQPQYRRFST